MFFQHKSIVVGPIKNVTFRRILLVLVLLHLLVLLQALKDRQVGGPVGAQLLMSNEKEEKTLKYLGNCVRNHAWAWKKSMASLRRR